MPAHKGPPLIERFMARAKVVDNGCWIWTAGTNDGGYGRFSIAHDRTVAAHRWAYEYFVGPIPTGFTVDHVAQRGCTSRLCVNWEHLEAVPLRTNLLRGKTLAARNASVTHCPAGHEYTTRNTYVYRNTRTCRLCRAQRAVLRRRIGLS